ncbi:MAG: hypothetical protein SynsKO_28640 [Synoicihabitans sp.]
MGKGKPTKPQAPQPAVSPAPEPEPPASEPPPAPAPDVGPVAPRLEAAFEQLELRNIDEARAIYEEILATPAGMRPDVLVRISGDLGATGQVKLIPELIAPLYDAERHGPATGMNLLQAYLALGNPSSAQHVLDLLFALKNPQIEERLWGFSNAIAEAMESHRRGSGGGGGETKVDLVSISKPIWAYGIEDLPDLLPTKSPGAKTVAFAQLSLPEHEDTDALAKKPEESLGRFSRGLPLWLAESLYFSPQYNSLGVIGMLGQETYMVFPAIWTGENIRQLVETSGSPIDYAVTGELREHEGDFDLTLHLWEIKGFRERKTFRTNWTPSTADQKLGEIHEQLRFFFECKAGPGLAYQAPVAPLAWINTLAASLSTFLVGKNVLPREQLTALPEPLIDPQSTPAAALARLTLSHRATAAELDHEQPDLPETDLITAARAHLTE